MTERLAQSAEPGVVIPADAGSNPAPLSDDQRIGGSEAAAAVGLDPYRSRVQLWLEKTGQVERPEAGEAAYWGSQLETIIADETRGRAQVFIGMSSAEAIYAPEYPFAVAHPDGFILPAAAGEPIGVYEGKTGSVFQATKWEDDAVPEPYVIQVQHYLALTGLGFGIVAALLGGQRFLWRRVERDDALIDLLMQREAEFWNLVQTGEPPAPDGSDSSDAMVKLLYPEARMGLRVHLTAEDKELIDRLKKIKASAKAAGTQADAIEQQLKMRMGDAELGIWEARPLLRWPTITARRLNQSRLKEEYPQVYEACAEPSSYRRFTVS